MGLEKALDKIPEKIMKANSICNDVHCQLSSIVHYEITSRGEMTSLDERTVKKLREQFAQIYGLLDSATFLIYELQLLLALKED